MAVSFICEGSFGILPIENQRVLQVTGNHNHIKLYRIHLAMSGVVEVKCINCQGECQLPPDHNYDDASIQVIRHITSEKTEGTIKNGPIQRHWEHFVNAKHTRFSEQNNHIF